MFVPPVGFKAPILPALAGRTVSRRLPICHLSKRVWRVANENSAGAHARQAGKLGSERAKEATRNGKYTYVEYARFADDLVVLIDAHPRHLWLLGAVTRRLREEFAKLKVEVNEEKSRTFTSNSPTTTAGKSRALQLSSHR